MRDILLKRLERDLIGPDKKNEVLASRPSDVYLTGILWPRQTQMGAEEDERLALSGGDDSDSGSSAEEGAISLAGLARPCTAGVSFAVRSDQGCGEIAVKVAFARYKLVESTESGTEHTNGKASKRPRWEWHRKAHDIAVDPVALDEASWFVNLEQYGSPPGVKLHVRTLPWEKGSLATVTLLNAAEPDKSEGRSGVEELTLFQVGVEVRSRLGTLFVARPSRRTILDEDDRSAELLYRNAHEFATGHTCSVRWKTCSDPATASMVGTSWIPSAKVPATSAVGHEVFDELRRKPNRNPLSARWLAGTEPTELKEGLEELPAAYGKWLGAQEDAVPSLPESLVAQARRNIRTCRKIQSRMSEGASRIAVDPSMAKAFRLANLAMASQHEWRRDKEQHGALEWRPFQLGFILLAAASVADRQHPEREIMDLLWFPTGGGKTEAYLALIALLAFYRRLSTGTRPNAGSGVAAVMRYTLRLLTTQQFARASAVLLACEAIRRGRIPGAAALGCNLGETPFSIGLWVGAEAVPNKVAEAAAALGGSPGRATPQQLVHCPACGKQLNWYHDYTKKEIRVRCQNPTCLLHDPRAPLPVWTVDEDVYRQRPTLLIGTIDKFAQIVRRKEVNELFGLDSGRPPDLIIQDELHLISGSLGTIAGLYEVAIDRMFASRGARPKIIGSTATIRRASDQVSALFDRQTAQFPPSCLDAKDSGFAVVDSAAPGRLYTAITTAGRSAKFALQAVAASLLQSASGATNNNKVRDPYWTLVSYFNSLRELGGALVLMQDDVNDSIVGLARRRQEGRRQPELIEELTSRRTQAEVRDMLLRLESRAGTGGALDIVLATNMLSVGVDIPRLGLMLVNGQPKGIAEYIQATSRVGRGNVAGLVVAVLNNSRPRDRSRYESFPTWHATLYRDVEPTSVTPFASRARDRALRAVLVALVRHLVPGMLDRPSLDDDSKNAARGLIQDIVKRAARIDPQETAVGAELVKHLGDWEFREPKSYWWRKVRDSLLQDAERAATLRAMGRMHGDAWPTLNNMRSIEPSTRFRLAEWLSDRPSRAKGDGA